MYRLRIPGTDLYYGTRKGRYENITNFSSTGKFYSAVNIKRVMNESAFIGQNQIKKYNLQKATTALNRQKWGNNNVFINTSCLELVKYRLEEVVDE